ncbi:MAG: hypothetical protein ABI142_08045 [Bryocella sp.]
MGTIKCIDKASEAVRIKELRATVVLEAFAFLELNHPSLTNMLLKNFGNRQKAARWMCVYQRSLGGKSAYEAVEDGNEGGVLNAIARATRQWNAATMMGTRMAQ